tara:strand:+ start:620 stop:862 length:243 start_codon:yes stop_codon:yes gene_type:complete
MSRPEKKQVTDEQANVIHKLLADCMETSLRQMLLSGEVNPQMVGKVIDYLKHNNVQVVATENKALASLSDLIAQIDPDSL